MFIGKLIVSMSIVTVGALVNECREFEISGAFADNLLGSQGDRPLDTTTTISR